jgi:hypothetical protein
MIALQLGALLVSLPTVEQAVELLEALGLSGRFPMPEIAEPSTPEPAVESQGPRPTAVRAPTRIAPRQPALVVAREPEPEHAPPKAHDVDAGILRAFGKDVRHPLHELARELFPDRPPASGIRLLKLRLASLEGSQQIHRVGAGSYRVGPSPRVGKRGPGRPPRATRYDPEHSFEDDDEREDAGVEDPDEELNFDALDAL